VSAWTSWVLKAIKDDATLATDAWSQGWSGKRKFHPLWQHGQETCLHLSDNAPKM
jgi:hypothetical protein